MAVIMATTASPDGPVLFSFFRLFYMTALAEIMKHRFHYLSQGGQFFMAAVTGTGARIIKKVMVASSTLHFGMIVVLKTNRQHRPMLDSLFSLMLQGETNTNQAHCRQSQQNFTLHRHPPKQSNTTT